MKLTLASLFDGSGTAPLAASMCGITPVWASEIEPYPIRVTTKRFPNMKHYGSITDIDGAKVEPVDIICGGSPCQDLSVAGKQAGLDGGTRSHLFYEMVRIIKEMRKATDGKKPRYIVWENVPGAFSSNNGYDFMSVLQSFAEIAEADVHVPEPERKANKLVWRYAGEMVGRGWSIAWRTVDAQYWGVLQRRRRIYLVVDLDSERAGEILFERKSLSGNTEPCGETRKGTSADAGNGAYAGCYPRIARCLTAEHDASPCIDRGQNICVYESKSALEENWSESEVKNALRANASKSDHYVVYSCNSKQQINVRIDEKSPTFRAENHGNHPCIVQSIAYSFDSIASNSMKSNNPRSGCRQVEVAKTLDTTASNPCENQGGIAIVEVYDARGNGNGKTVNTLTGDHNNRITDYTSIVVDANAPVYSLQGNGIDRSETAGCNGKGWKEDVGYTLNTIDRPAVVFAMQAFGDYKKSDVSSGLKARDYKDATDLVCGVDCRNMNESPELYPTLQAKSNGGQSLNFSHAIRVNYIVRRLTPLECSRLQGFPDCWELDLETPNPTEEDIAFWAEVFETHRKIVSPDVKPKTRNQIIKWLKDPYSDSASYKMWGNGMALPNMLFVVSRIKEAHDNA